MPRCTYRGWVLVSPRSIIEFPFERLVAHSHCLTLYNIYATYQRRESLAASDGPLSLAELVKALELRRVFNKDACACMIHNRFFNRMVLWEHSFFGVQSAWSVDGCPWGCLAGNEVYCADPVEVSQLSEFACSYLVSATAEHDGTATVTWNYPSNSLLDLPPELFQAVLSSLPLRNVTSVRNTCRKARALLSDAASFWRSTAINLYGDWFWELKDRDIFPQYTTNWRRLLRQIEITRSEILDSAGALSSADLETRRKTHRCCQECTYRPMLLNNKGCLRLPLGLKNRLRIWCCIASIGNDGKQIALHGQRKGLDPPNMPEWDGASSFAACPSCGRGHGISFNRLKIIAGRTD